MLLKLLARTTLIAGLITASASFAATKGNDILGDYTCTGSDPTQEPAAYTGKITVTKQGQQYIMAETDTNSNNNEFVYHQFALRKGDNLFMAFQQNNDPAVFGAQQMHISKGGKHLAGEFSYWGTPNKVGTEVCNKA